ncbi:transglycosylase domain-containing protein [Corynebacterium camporealensis]|uniref:transglycosylase domain-containing protein n=1 Tax=Corynebacterium camporealensis TaxID=161896 RepID=UPI00052BDE73|nr:transglycosylase domain-containing protein [Corynebacterium camporealensis]
MSTTKSLGKIGLATVLVGVLTALTIAPFAGLTGVVVARANDTMQSDLQDLTAGDAPGVTTIQDSTGEDLAYLYNQRRHPVEFDAISQHMKDAIVAIEDNRFYEHDGVDLQGNLRALWTNLAAGGISQGASTLNQQYVKNYLLLVSAETDEERAAATEQSIPRKLREMSMAAEMDRDLSKEEILANYLNLVPFGNHAYGVEAAARTYFGHSAADLTVPQSALLAGIVQSSEYLNPYTNPEGATERRNLVLQAMADNGYLDQAAADGFKQEGLGVLDSPALLPDGCIGANDRGFFCDYVLEYLSEKGLDAEELSRGGYTIHTTLDPQVQDASLQAVQSRTSPDAAGVAEVMSVVKPSRTDRDVLAMVSSREYGLDLDANETLLPQPYSLVGNGAGSVFKAFTAAAALDAGYGVESELDVPERYEAEGLGFGGAEDCPPSRYCVENAGTYPATLTLQDALAQSPNTTFIKLIEQVGVAPVVDMSVKLGLRSYNDPGSYDGDSSIAEHAKDANMGSYTLGPTAVNPLELSNVGATIAAGGRWCEPNPVESVTDRNGNEVYLPATECEQAVDRELADALSNALSKDTDNGTAANSARSAGFGAQVGSKTGTTESNQSSAYLAFNSEIAAAPYIYNDGTSTTPLCSGPVRQCGSGNLYGGLEPAQTFFGLANSIPQVSRGGLPGYDDKYNEGTSTPLLDDLRGKSESEARRILEDEGYTVKTARVVGGNVPYGRVVRAVPFNGPLRDGSEVTLQLSDGSSASNTPSSGTADANSTGNTDGGGNDPAPRRNNNGPRSNNPGPSWPSQDDIDSFANDVRNFFGL